ncbi:MAG: hypothetical protein K2X94_00005, partial [Amoebophilaceae bacterium]|nr:hypothetical protein [Amoebophilaceae bacterium]
MTLNFKQTLLACSFITLSVLISGCINTGHNESSNNGTTTLSQSNDLIIEPSATIPVLANSTTNSIIYVHNNSSQQISGISYTVINNAATNNQFKITANQCSTIAAQQSCALEFTTPIVDDISSNGSAIIQAHHDNKTTQQLVNYSKVTTDSQHGIQFMPTTDLLNESSSFNTLYLYTNSENNYTLEHIRSQNPQLTITQQHTNKNAQQQIIAIEVYKSKSAIGESFELSATSRNVQNHQLYTNNLNLSTTPINNGAILTVGATPVTNTANTRTASILVINSGNLQATSISPVYPALLTQTSGTNSCGSTLAANAYCYIYYTINDTSNSGESTITINYSGGSQTTISKTVSWYNQKGTVMLVGVNPTQNPLLLFNNSGSTNVTIQNLGQNTLTGITITPKDASTIINNTCSSLVKTATCTFTLKWNSSSSPSRVLFEVKGNYVANGNKAYSRLYNLPTAQATYASVNVWLNSSSGFSSGDGSSGNPWKINTNTTAYLTFIYSNSGNQTAQNFSTTVSGTLPAGWTVYSNSCSSALAAGANCTVVFSFSTSSSGSHNFSGVILYGTWTDQARPSGATTSTSPTYYVNTTVPVTVAIKYTGLETSRGQYGHYQLSTSDGSSTTVNISTSCGSIAYGHGTNLSWVNSTQVSNLTISGNVTDVYMLYNRYCAAGASVSFSVYSTSGGSALYTKYYDLYAAGQLYSLVISNNMYTGYQLSSYISAGHVCDALGINGKPAFNTDPQMLYKMYLYWRNDGITPIGITTDTGTSWTNTFYYPLFNSISASGGSFWSGAAATCRDNIAGKDWINASAAGGVGNAGATGSTFSDVFLTNSAYIGMSGYTNCTDYHP